MIAFSNKACLAVLNATIEKAFGAINLVATNDIGGSSGWNNGPCLILNESFELNIHGIKSFLILDSNKLTC